MATSILTLAVDADGCRITEPSGIALEPFRQVARRGGEFALDVCHWVDQWADSRGVIDVLDDRGTSLWWFVRPHMVYQFLDLLPDIDALSLATDDVGCDAIRLQGINPHWSKVAAVVARERRLELSAIRTPVSTRLWGAVGRFMDGAVLAARAAAAVPRGRHRPSSAPVAALVYPVCKRVVWNGTLRFLEPTFEPILLELERRNLELLKLSAPSVNGWRHEWRWLRQGDSTAIPIELSLIAWLARTGGGTTDDAQGALHDRLRRLVPDLLRAQSVWGGHDVSKEVHAFVRRTLVPRVRRAARDIRFFEHLFARARPQTLLVSDEYAGLAMAATAAARRTGMSVVAVQHGVIWRGHPGYTLPKTRVETMPKPNRLCVFGAYDRNIVLAHGPYHSNEVVITGSPRFDLVVNRPPATTRAHLAAFVGVAEATPLILFSSTGESHLLASRLAEQLAAGQAPLGVLVKLHPLQERDPSAFQALLPAVGRSQVRVIREEFDLYDLLRLVDVHLSMNSTVLSEAAAFERPNIMLLTDIAVDTVRYVERGVAVRAEDYCSLSDAVADVLYGPAADRLRDGRRDFVAQHFHRLDGHATRRAADVVEQSLREWA